LSVSVLEEAPRHPQG